MEIVYQKSAVFVPILMTILMPIDNQFFITCWLSTFEPPRGLEPRTYSLRMSCSTNWAMVAVWFSAIYIAIQSILAQFSASKPATHALRMRCSTNWATMATRQRTLLKSSAKVLLFCEICKYFCVFEENFVILSAKRIFWNKNTASMMPT